MTALPVTPTAGPTYPALVVPSFDAWPAAVTRPQPQLTLVALSIRRLDHAGQHTLVARHLSNTEQAQYRSLAFARRRLEWLGGRLAVKTAVTAFCGATEAVPDLALVEVRSVNAGSSRGRPLVNRPAWVSLSHSAGVAVAAAASVPVGIDVERQRPLAPMLAEALRLDPIDARQPTMPLHLRWSCKEAVLKCLGVGLRIDSRQVMLTEWDASGWFSWQPGPMLRAELPPGGPDPAEIVGWAGQQDGYSFACAFAQPAALDLRVSP